MRIDKLDQKLILDLQKDTTLADEPGFSEEGLKTAFDSIWNACGLPRSLNYDANGNWVGR